MSKSIFVQVTVDDGVDENLTFDEFRTDVPPEWKIALVRPEGGLSEDLRKAAQAVVDARYKYGYRAPLSDAISYLEKALAAPEWCDIATLDSDRTFSYIALIEQTVDADENGLNTRREFIGWQELPGGE